MTDHSDRLYAFAFHKGYVEEQSISTILMEHDTGFETPAQAILSLKAAFTQLIKENRKRYHPVKKDCVADKCPNESTPFCSQCGTQLSMPEKVEDDEIAEMVRSLFSNTLAECGHLYEVFCGHGWILGVDISDTPGPWTTCVALDCIIEDAESKEDIAKMYQLYNPK